MTDPIGVREIENGEIGIVSGRFGEVGPCLCNQADNRVELAFQGKQGIVLCRQLGKRRPEQAIHVESRVARPGPGNAQREFLLVHAGAHGEEFHLLIPRPFMHREGIEVSLEVGQLCKPRGHGGGTEIRVDVGFETGNIDQRLRFFCLFGIQPQQEIVEERNEFVVAALPGRHTGKFGSGRYFDEQEANNESHGDSGSAVCSHHVAPATLEASSSLAQRRRGNRRVIAATQNEAFAGARPDGPLGLMTTNCVHRG